MNSSQQNLQKPCDTSETPDFLEFQHNANGNLYRPLCDTCGKEQDAPIPLEGDGTGVQIRTVVTSQSEPLRDMAMRSSTPYPVITRSSTPSYYEAATVCTKCASTLDYCHCAEDILPVPPPAERIVILSPVPADTPSTGRVVGYDVVGTVSSGTSDVASAIDIWSSCKDNKEADACQAEEAQPVRVETAHGGGDAPSQDPVR